MKGALQRGAMEQAFKGNIRPTLALFDIRNLALKRIGRMLEFDGAWAPLEVEGYNDRHTLRFFLLR